MQGQGLSRLADSEAAYGQALLWHITGDKAYARNAIRIMNAWSDTLTGGHTNANAQVQASWTGDVFPRAAEIIRYTYTADPMPRSSNSKTC